ncbi:TetR family transcriptional regulator [Catellatospora sp. TT07R-123]|uniref:TetR/AcrR family transcriptional regulator n=1 Tax=Catellatospora sp. TT07R-123 TaxID=2733863 RepID=UPI001B0DC52C|nr:TetR/AcrR family transcriptional regulator [Catellatospora sp. TT07R-123]GHJ43008.1 TetR family transcriptional regulator [Catellatospora sp. TT07R-123]
METDLGLRERKKRQTRQLITDVATEQFARRGFDAVTVADIAQAVGVSTKTVFNYFPRKEDLFFDRFANLVELVTTTLRDRGGTPPLPALRAMFLDLLARRNPLSGYAEPDYAGFWRVVVESPNLQARAREFVQELEDLIADLLGEAAGTDPGGFRVRFTAAAVVSVYRTVFLTGARRITAGEDHTAVNASLADLYTAGFAAIDRALAGLPA